MPVSSGDIAIILKGRRRPVMKDMAAAVLKNPETYFKNKQAKGALFQEDFQAPSGERYRPASAWAGFWPGSTFCSLCFLAA